MSARILRIALWAIGMALVGFFFASLESYSTTLYGTLLDRPLYPIAGAALGAGIGFLFSLRAAKAKL